MATAKPCACGCGGQTRGRFLNGHAPVKAPFHPCACGCGGTTRGEYLRGHRPGKSRATYCLCGCGVRTNGEYVSGHRPKMTCTRCSRPFTQRSRGEDGLCSNCRKVVASGGGAFNYALSITRQKNSAAPEGKRWCNGCQRYRAVKFFRRPTDGNCKPCQRKRDHDYMVQKTYGITPDQYAAIKEVQQGKCAICQRATGASKALAIDHDHRCCPGGGSCGKCIRGLLCSICNRMLGYFRDDPNAFGRAMNYLIIPPARAVLGSRDWSQS